MKKLHHFGCFSPSRRSRCNTKINASPVNECQLTASCTKIFLAQHFCYPHFSISFFLWIIFSELILMHNHSRKKKHFMNCQQFKNYLIQKHWIISFIECNILFWRRQSMMTCPCELFRSINEWQFRFLNCKLPHSHEAWFESHRLSFWVQMFVTTDHVSCQSFLIHI